jgi:hypothetical protein
MARRTEDVSDRLTLSLMVPLIVGLTAWGKLRLWAWLGKRGA